MLALLVVCVALVAAACSSEPGGASEGDDRTAAVYRSILSWFVDAEGPLAEDHEADWVMFIATRSEEPIDIDVQAALVEGMESDVFVRFIDARAEAVDEESDNEVVRDDGILIGLGAVPDESDTVEVYTDRYRDATDVEAWLVTIRRSGDNWQVVGEPEPTDVRPLASPE